MVSGSIEKKILEDLFLFFWDIIIEHELCDLVLREVGKAGGPDEKAQIVLFRSHESVKQLIVRDLVGDGLISFIQRFKVPQGRRRRGGRQTHDGIIFHMFLPTEDGNGKAAEVVEQFGGFTQKVIIFHKEGTSLVRKKKYLQQLYNKSDNGAILFRKKW